VTVPWDVTISTVGTAAATIIGVIVGGFIGSRAQTRHWSLTAQSEACINLLREQTATHLLLARANYQNPGQRLESSLWSPWNQALSAVNLLADPRIVSAAHQIDTLFWRMHLRIERGGIGEDEWQAIQGELRTAQLHFINTVRAHLGRKEAPLRNFSGRPPDTDSIWRHSAQ
jgi:hypothetical protein